MFPFEMFWKDVRQYGSCHSRSISQMFRSEKQPYKKHSIFLAEEGSGTLPAAGVLDWIPCTWELAEGMTDNSPNPERSLKARTRKVFLQCSTVTGASWERTFATLGEATCLGRATTQWTGRTKICWRHHCIFNAVSHAEVGGDTPGKARWGIDEVNCEEVVSLKSDDVSTSQWIDDAKIHPATVVCRQHSPNPNLT